MNARLVLRGQTLLLFALTLLLLTVMVMMTIGIGVRIHERQEQQIVADAAAYSQAVVTARTFNSLSALNRVLVAQLASIAAAQSMLSWAGFYHGTLNQARDMLGEIAGQAACGAGMFDAARERIEYEDRRLIDIWEPPGAYGGVSAHDLYAGDYIRRDLYETALDIAEHQRLIHGRLRDLIDANSNNPVIATRIAQEAKKGSPWRNEAQELYARRQVVTDRELDRAILPRQLQPLDMMHAVMASRGIESFTSAREATPVANEISASEYVARRINRVIDPSPLRVIVRHYGTSYFGRRGPMRSTGPGELEGYDGQAIQREQWEDYLSQVNGAGYGFQPIGAWAQDSGTFRFDWPGAPPGCRIPEPTEDSFGYILSTHRDDDRDNHMWRRGNRGYGDYREHDDELGHVARRHWPDRRHTFLRDPGAGGILIWPVYVDFNAERVLDDVRDAELDAYGQPKTLVNIRKNYAARGTRDPWDLRFRFNLSRDGVPGTRLDLRGDRPGLTVSTALAAGLTYYHRGRPESESRGRGHFAEPPNFLNPFWRATLVASDVDERYRDRGDSVIQTLEGFGETEQADALSRLRRRGFEAIP